MTSAKRPEPLISVVTVNLNDASGLSKTLHSVVRQDYENYEHIVIDGASIDSSIETWRKIVAGDQRFTIVSEIDSGIYDAMNKGIALSRGDIIQILNAGDTLADTTVFSRVAESWATDVNWSWGFGGLRLLNSEGSQTQSILNPSFDLDNFRWGHSYVPHPSSFVSSHLFEIFGNFNPKYGIAADQEFFFRIAANHPPKIWNGIFVNFALGGAHSSLNPWQRERVLHHMRKANSMLAFNSNLLDVIITEILTAWRIGNAIIKKCLPQEK